MALIYPKETEFQNYGEEYVYNSLKEQLPFNNIVYYNYLTGTKEFDFLVLVPSYGIVILEVKAWYADRIIKIKDNKRMIYRNSKGAVIPESSPFIQANIYRYSILNRIRDELDKNIPVIPVVCYPNITKEEYHNKRLDIFSPQEWTIFKEDIEEEKLKNRMISILDQDYGFSCDAFEEKSFYNVRGFFETQEQIDESKEEMEKQLKEKNKGKNLKKPEREHYSILKYISENDSDYNIEINKLIEYWATGTKIMLISNSNKVLQEAKVALKQKIEEMKLDFRFEIQDSDGNWKNLVFNFFFYYIDFDLKDDLEIINGKIEDIDANEGLLEVIDKKCFFNFNQYKVEHAPTDRNIVIKAGAGSGKTFSMISRISFLIYAHGFSVGELKKAITLITFTNEAAKNMKRRLQEYFQNYYLITRDYNFFRMIEAIEEMRISTIHSLSKKIIQKYSAELGLGKDFAIVSGKYDRGIALQQELDGYIREKLKTDSNYISKLKLSMYNLLRRLRGFQEKLENKNLDIVNDNLNLGKSLIPELDETIKTVLKNSEGKLREEFISNNQIRLSDLIIKLKELVNSETLGVKDISTKYVFVDEFQDTDDVQIDLLKKFQQKLDFKFFIVGDIKQCIYRFRGAQDKAFKRLLGFDDDDKRLNKWGLSFNLNKNYRTDQLLLQNFERIFEKWGNGSDSKLAYESNKDRLVSHIEINKSGDEYFKEISIVNQDDDEEFEKKFIEELNARIEDIEDDEKVAILVRENKDVEKIVKIGLKHGKYIETDVGGNLFQLISTLDLYKLVLALQNSTTPKHLYNIYETSYTKANLPKEQIYNFKNNTKGLLEYFEKNPPIDKWKDYLWELKHEPVLKVLRDIIKDIRPWENYVSKIQDRETQSKLQKYYKRNLDEVFEKLTQISTSDYLTINTIEEYLRIMILTKQNEVSREEYRAESTDSKVVCMTIHKSKGLEFHTVMLPFTDKDLESEKKSGPVDVITTHDNRVGFKILLDEKIDLGYTRSYYLENKYYNDEKNNEKLFKLNEETRILYVAMTRAVKNFIYFNYKDSKIKNSWQKLIREG